MSQYQKGKTNLNFTEAKDSEWQWHQLGHMQVAPCSRHITTPAPHNSVFTGRMPFLPPNQQCQSTEGKGTEKRRHISTKQPQRLRKYSPNSMIEMFHLGHLQTLALQQCGWYCYIQRFDELSSASSSSSITHRLSSASLMWLFVPFGSRSVAHEKLISARCVLPSFLCTFTIRQQAAVVTTAKGHIS